MADDDRHRDRLGHRAHPAGPALPLWGALVAFFAAALIWGPWTSLSMAVFQDASPQSALASLLAARGSLLVIAAPLGAALGGPLVAGLGARGTLLTSALGTVAVGAAAAVFGRTRALSPHPALDPDVPRA